MRQQARPTAPILHPGRVTPPITGPVISAAIQGNHAVLGVGPHLVVVDISNTDAPTVVGKTNIGLKELSDSE